MKWGSRAVLVFLGVAALAPSATGAGLTPQVRLGGPPPGAQAPAIGGLNPGALIHFSVTLKPRTGLAAFVHEVSDPTSPNYRAYLTPGEFGRRFGATPSQVAAVEASLRAHGMTPGTVAANRLSIPVTADAATVQRAFAVSLRRVRLVSGRTAVVPNAAPAVDVPVAGDVQAVVGLTSVAVPRPLLARSALRGHARGSRPHVTGHVSTGGPQPCSAASSTGSSARAYTADQMASSYRFSGLYGAGNLGQGQTIAMYELEPNDPNDIAQYQACYGTHAPVSYVAVDGGVGSGQGSGEAALDIEVAAGLAPRATILVYQGPNSSSGTPGSGPYDTFSKIVNEDRAQVISTSWGSCEPDNGTAAANSESTLFQQAAAEGQTILAASGDAGSEDCNGDTPPNPTALAVDDPGSQPYVTSVGGTTLSGLGPPPSQTVWNTGGSPLAIANPSSGAGGGGVSQTWKMPAYQANAAGSLNVQQANSSGSVCSASSGLCRQVPDVSADADPNTGYVVYWNGSGGDATSTQGWQVEAGTSAAAPLWAALVALVNGSSGCHGSPIGFANPTLYQAAGNNYGASFDDITSGNNDYTGLNGGKYPAGPFYDMATGLGSPNGAGLAGSLCPAAFRVNNPGRQSSSVGQNVSLQLSTTGRGSGVVYGVTGLPPGLSLNSGTGRITGKPKKVGAFTVGVAAIAPDGAERGTAFVWQISGRPSLSGGRLSALSSSRPRLQLTLKAAGGAPGLKSVALRAPSGLRFVLGRGQVSVRGAGRPISRRQQLRGGRLVIILSKPQKQIKVQVSRGALSASRGLSSRARRHRAVSLVFKLTATDSQGLQTQLALRVKSRG